jgi:hypothetical protein
VILPIGTARLLIVKLSFRVDRFQDDAIMLIESKFQGNRGIVKYRVGKKIGRVR